MSTIGFGFQIPPRGLLHLHGKRSVHLIIPTPWAPITTNLRTRSWPQPSVPSMEVTRWTFGLKYVIRNSSCTCTCILQRLARSKENSTSTSTMRPGPWVLLLTTCDRSPSLARIPWAQICSWISLSVLPLSPLFPRFSMPLSFTRSLNYDLRLQLAKVNVSIYLSAFST